jgi:hypothetical protein
MHNDPGQTDRLNQTKSKVVHTSLYATLSCLCTHCAYPHCKIGGMGEGRGCCLSGIASWYLHACKHRQSNCISQVLAYDMLLLAAPNA